MGIFNFLFGGRKQENIVETSVKTEQAGRSKKRVSADKKTKAKRGDATTTNPGTAFPYVAADSGGSLSSGGCAPSSSSYDSGGGGYSGGFDGGGACAPQIK